VVSRFQALAPKARAMASSPRSRDITPSATPTNTTGEAATRMVTATVPSVEPNQIIARTIQAIGGTPSSTVTSGRASLSVAGE